MDNKLECDIVKELSIQYIEKTINIFPITFNILSKPMPS